MTSSSRFEEPQAPPAWPSVALALVVGWFLLRLVNSGSRQGSKGREQSRAEPPQAMELPTGFERKQNAPLTAVAEQGRGRQAETPAGIPAKGWKDILWRVYEEFQKDRVMAIAAGVTYYALLALFPAVAALVSIYGLFADPGTLQNHLEALSGVLPSGALEIIGDQVRRIASKGQGTLGLSFAIGLALSLWSANAGMKALFDALNIVYGEDEKRGFLWLNLRSLAFTLGTIIFVLFALVGIVAVPIILNFVGLGSGTERLVQFARWPLLLLGVIAGLALLYRYGPSREEAKWHWVTPGGIVAAFLWLGVSMLFSWYVANFGSYNETYGSLGAVIVFMTWIWISSIIVLLGAEINAEMEHQTAQDTTSGPEAPIGARGATMADTIGAAKS